MNRSSKINSYLMAAKCTVSYHSVGFVVSGDLKLTLLVQGVIYLLILQSKRFFWKMLAKKLQVKGTQ